MSKPPPRSGPIPSKPGAPQSHPTRSAPASKGASGTSEGVPEGASSFVPHYTSASKVAAASARGAAASEAPWSGLSGLSPPGPSLRPPSHQGSTVSMGSSGRTTLVQAPAPVPPMVTPPTPAGPAAPPSAPASMRFLFLYHHVHSHLVPAHRLHRLITQHPALFFFFFFSFQQFIYRGI